MAHPRRVHVDQLLAVLAASELAGGRVFEAPLAALDGRGSADVLPAIAVNYRGETVSDVSGASAIRTLELAVVAAARTPAEADDLAGELEDLVAALGVWRLVAIEFGLEGPDRGAERPFFVHVHIYRLEYMTSSGG